MLMRLRVKRTELAKQFPMLAVAKDGDVGLDIPACVDVNDYPYGQITIHPGHRALVPTGIRVELPEGYWASIEARSSTSKNSIIVPKGIIDEGYRGEIFAQLINVGIHPFTVCHGDRLIQMIVHKRHIRDFVIDEVDELSESVRGESGFGSTGTSSTPNREVNYAKTTTGAGPEN